VSTEGSQPVVREDYTLMEAGLGLPGSASHSWRKADALARAAADNGSFPISYGKSALSQSYIPVFIYYNLLQSNGTCNSCTANQRTLANLNNAGLMQSYFQNFTLPMQCLGTGTYGGIRGLAQPAIVDVEPDLSGMAEQAIMGGKCSGFCTSAANNPASLTAAVASSGDPSVAHDPDTFQGFNWALLHLRDLYAPNVLLAVHVSDWATNIDIGSSSKPGVDAMALGQHAGDFAAHSGAVIAPPGTSTYDQVFNDPSDHDAGWQSTVNNNPSVWWDRNNVTLPNFHQSYVPCGRRRWGLSENGRRAVLCQWRLSAQW
jgi:hypothetical protein